MIVAVAQRGAEVYQAALFSFQPPLASRPVTKADIEAIRGVQVGSMLRTRVDRGLIRVTGSACSRSHRTMCGSDLRVELDERSG